MPEINLIIKSISMTCFHYVLPGGLSVYTKSLKTPEGHLQPPGVLTLDHFCQKKRARSGKII